MRSPASLAARASRRTRATLGLRVRQALREVVYGSRDLPDTLPVVTASYGGLSARSSWPSDISRVDLLTCPTVLGATQAAHLCYPAASPALHAVRNRLVIHIGGHSAAGHYYASDGQAWLTYTLVREGFHVLGCCMPMTGFNASTETYSTGAVSNHDFSAIETAGYSGLRPFVDGVICAINHVFAEHSFDTIDLVGLSGGGWMTTMIAALDPRIRKSISVFGGAPWSLRAAIGSSATGDWEQLAARSWVPALRGLEEAAYVAGCCDEGRRRIMVMGTLEGAFPVGSHLSRVEHLRQWVDERVPEGQHEIHLDTIAAHDISATARTTIITEAGT